MKKKYSYCKINKKQNQNKPPDYAFYPLHIRDNSYVQN